MKSKAEFALEQAASLLTRRESALIRTYGSVGEEASKLSDGWVKIALALNQIESRSDAE